MCKCKIDGCNNPAKTRGWCCKHYTRWQRHGDPNVVNRNRCGYSKKYPKLYTSFWSMHDRCEKPNHPHYKYYGERGIKICDRWSGTFGLQNFIDDMGIPPKGHTLDRIDVNGDYCPENCRWADRYTQTTNTTVRRKYSKRHGVTYNVGDGYWWAYIKVKGKRYVKLAHTEEEAIKKREELEMKYLGRVLY